MRPEASLFHDEDRVAESGETARMALYAINNGVNDGDALFYVPSGCKTRHALVPHGMSSS